MLNQNESEQHRRIKLKLAQFFRDKGWSVVCVDGEEEETEVVENNDSVGDSENKRPDIDAKYELAKRIIRGEVKIDNGDFESEHSLTQFKLFSNRNLNGINSWLIIGVPFGKKEKMEKVLAENLNKGVLENIAVWEC